MFLVCRFEKGRKEEKEERKNIYELPVCFSAQNLSNIVPLLSCCEGAYSFHFVQFSRVFIANLFIDVNIHTRLQPTLYWIDILTRYLCVCTYLRADLCLDHCLYTLRQAARKEIFGKAFLLSFLSFFFESSDRRVGILIYGTADNEKLTHASSLCSILL